MRRKFVLERSKAYICSENINVVTYAEPRTWSCRLKICP